MLPFRGQLTFILFVETPCHTRAYFFSDKPLRERVRQCGYFPVVGIGSRVSRHMDGLTVNK